MLTMKDQRAMKMKINLPKLEWAMGVGRIVMDRLLRFTAYLSVLFLKIKGKLTIESLFSSESFKLFIYLYFYTFKYKLYFL